MQHPPCRGRGRRGRLSRAAWVPSGAWFSIVHQQHQDLSHPNRRPQEGQEGAPQGQEYGFRQAADGSFVVQQQDFQQYQQQQQFSQFQQQQQQQPVLTPNPYSSSSSPPPSSASFLLSMGESGGAVSAVGFPAVSAAAAAACILPNL